MTFEEITDNETVINLTPQDLVIHARHQLLSAAKDLIKQSDPGEIEFALACSEQAEALQLALDLGA